MRKIIMALVVAFTAAVCNAASYEEEQLLGYWEVTEMDGYILPSIQSFTGIYFGIVYEPYNPEGCSDSAEDFIFWNGEKAEQNDNCGYGFFENFVEPGYGEFDMMFMTYQIYNENKLNIDGWAQFKIEELTATTMKLVSRLSPKPCHITLKKTDKYSSAKVVAEEAGDAEEASFDMEGRRVSADSKGIVISTSKRGAKKVMRR